MQLRWFIDYFKCILANLFLAVFFFSLLTAWAPMDADAASGQGHQTGLAPVIHLGFIPGEGKEGLKKSTEALAELISQKTGIKIVPYVGSTYSDLIAKIEKKEVDIAFLSALSYAEAQSHVSLKVLLKKVWQQGFYYSVILVPADSKIRKLSDLRGKRIGLVDKNSGSGSLYPLLALRKAGLKGDKDFKSLVYTGSHDKSVEALKSKQVDAIAVFANDVKGRDSAWTQNGGKLKDARIIWVSEAIPNDPLCVRTEFYDSFPRATHDFMFSLLELNDDKAHREAFRDLLGIKSLMMATSQQYEPVRELQKNLRDLISSDVER